MVHLSDLRVCVDHHLPFLPFLLLGSSLGSLVGRHTSESIHPLGFDQVMNEKGLAIIDLSKIDKKLKIASLHLDIQTSKKQIKFISCIFHFLISFLSNGVNNKRHR